MNVIIGDNKTIDLYELFSNFCIMVIKQLIDPAASKILDKQIIESNSITSSYGGFIKLILNIKKKINKQRNDKKPRLPFNLIPKYNVRNKQINSM